MDDLYFAFIVTRVKLSLKNLKPERETISETKMKRERRVSNNSTRKSIRVYTTWTYYAALESFSNAYLWMLLFLLFTFVLEFYVFDRLIQYATQRSPNIHVEFLFGTNCYCWRAIGCYAKLIVTFHCHLTSHRVKMCYFLSYVPYYKKFRYSILAKSYVSCC